MKAWVRRHPLAALIIPALVMLFVGLVAGQFVKSPAQVAADAAPPEQTTLTAPVEKGKVQRTESADAQIKPTAPEVVAPAPPGGGAEKAVVSAIHVSVGGKAEAGTSLVDVAGRPTFVLPGDLAAYRTLGPAMTGPDVTQLQAALRTLGYKIPDDEKTFGAATKEAVNALYTDRGYKATRVGDEEADAAAKAETAASRAVQQAKVALSRAERDYAAAKKGSGDGQGETGTGDGKSKGGSGESPSKDAIEDAKTSLTQAQEDLKAAQETLAKARDAAGPQIPLGEVAFLRHLPAVVDAIGVSVGAEVGTGTITLASGDVAAIAKLAKAQTSQLEVGDAATLITPDGTRIQGSVTDVTTLSPEEGQVEGAVQVTVTPETPLDAGLRGTTIRVNIATSTSEQETLKVPEAAVTTGADSKSRVRVKETSGSYRDVEVTVGESGDGMVGVAAVDRQLAEGDSVVVGILR